MTARGHIRRHATVTAACLAVLSGGLLLGGCGNGDDGKDGRGNGRGQGAEETREGRATLSEAQRDRADQMLTVFENGTTEPQYDYAENLGDGRGVTAGRIGFTTSDGDALTVVRAYAKEVPGNPLARFAPELERLRKQNSGDTEGLPEERYVAAWKRAAKDEKFREIQDRQIDRRYYGPAMREADRVGLKTPLARAELYDTAVQHGAGHDPDSLHALVRRTTKKAGTVGEAGEKKWLDAFLSTRAANLRSPSNEATADEWKKSVDRVEAIRRLADRGNYDLDGPFKLKAFGGSYSIE
ncbi:chitosanase [Streptomyces sp. NPDC048172]|uniref:chitosanase n=1 Tax=Streptomyces sp. NPDC048172 TaxID=3365505 RepID=UPI00371B7F2D